MQMPMVIQRRMIFGGPIGALILCMCPEIRWTTKHPPSLHDGAAGECRMTKEIRMTKAERRQGCAACFANQASSLIRHSSFPLGFPFVDQNVIRSEEHTSELQSLRHLVCRLLLEK